MARAPRKQDQGFIGEKTALQVFEEVRDDLLRELKRWTRTVALRRELPTEDLAMLLKICRESIAMHVEHQDSFSQLP